MAVGPAPMGRFMSLLLPAAAAVLLGQSTTVGAPVHAAAAGPSSNEPRSGLFKMNTSWTSSGCGGPGLRPDPDFPDWYSMTVQDPLVGPVRRWFPSSHRRHCHIWHGPSLFIGKTHAKAQGAADSKMRSWHWIGSKPMCRQATTTPSRRR